LDVGRGTCSWEEEKEEEDAVNDWHPCAARDARELELAGMGMRMIEKGKKKRKPKGSYGRLRATRSASRHDDVTVTSPRTSAERQMDDNKREEEEEE
jgi:hypothetical protein